MSRGLSHRAVVCIAGLASFALASILAVSSARAQAMTVTMTYTGAEGNQSGNVFVYPYQFNLNGNSVTVDLMCDDFVHEISPPETWTANVLPVSALNSSNVAYLQFGSITSGGAYNATVQQYLEAAQLFTDEAAAYTDGNSDPHGLYNWATWDLMTGVDESADPPPPATALSGSDESQVQSYLNTVETVPEGPDLTPSDFPNVYIFTPIDTPTQSPQEFLGMGNGSMVVPEPATLSVLGVAVFGLLGRRKRS